MSFNKKYNLFLLTLLLIGLALTGVGCQAFAAHEFKGFAMNPAPDMPDFELTTAEGQSFHLADNAGDITLIYFGYTYCPDVCPLTMWEIKKALDSLESGRENVHVIFISVDPERDSPDVLTNYMAAFGPEFTGLRDDMEKVQAMMKPYGAFSEKEEVEDSALGYLVSHTARLYLVDTNQQLSLSYPFGFTGEELHSDLAYLLQQAGL